MGGGGAGFVRFRGGASDVEAIRLRWTGAVPVDEVEVETVETTSGSGGS